MKRVVLGMAAVLLLAWGTILAAVVVWGARDEARPAAAIIVLGAAQYAGRPSPVFRARLDHAIDLWNRGFAPHLIVTGGMGIGDTTSEAAVGRRYALRRGVPDSAILLEAHGRTTSESLRAVSGIMDQLPSKSAILVSDPFHMLRLSIIAGRLGLVPHPSPTRTSPIARNRGTTWRYIVSESIKVPLAFVLEGNGL